jgi:mannose/cellobiose epimerase-like protein (N-acyl-D-glucosamine 2-epimerase family)
MGEAIFASGDGGGHPLHDPVHRAFLRAEARRQLAFFRPSLREDGGFDVLEADGTPIAGAPQELHTTTRLVHSYALALSAGMADAAPVVDAGLAFLGAQHRDPAHGGYFWAVAPGRIVTDTKLAYGHVFVVLAGASAHVAGHPDARALISDAIEVIERHFWDEARGLLRDEMTRDWQPFSTYRGMNANMHGIEAFLAAYEATGQEVHLLRAGKMLDFFTARIAPRHGWRIPEHYDADWQVDPAYRGDQMFRPPGTTPGHSFELARLMLQHWDLAGRPATDAPAIARRLMEQALTDGWLNQGGFLYTLDLDGRPSLRDRLWWPVTEAIGALAAFMKIGAQPTDSEWYERLWRFAAEHYIDTRRGGWLPEIGEDGRPSARLFRGKPDIYHSLQAALHPLAPGLSRLQTGLRGALDAA